MEVQLYNTLTRKKEPFVPQQPGQVSMYVCGPTVYDYIHIGNARPAIFFDVVRRFLEVVGYEVRYIVNFTDVDDKLIRKAEEMETTVTEVADTFIAAFQEDVAALGVRPATHNPRVTEHMEEIISFIQGLVDKGFAYASGGDVYFQTQRFDEYGKLSQQNLQELQHGIRIEVDARKQDAQDFVLWKGAKPGEIKWDSPWGEGRPGWHIECSAMARTYLGDTLDIHGGGLDLQFPHHECEIAQSESYTGKPLARYWMHNGYIHINNEKMSKSLGNGITVKKLLARMKPTAVRYLMLSAHYRSPLNVTEEVFAQAENSVERIAIAYGNLRHRLNLFGEAAARKLAEAGADAAERSALLARLEQLEARFRAKLADDFNTPDAITVWFELVAESNAYLQRKVTDPVVLEALLELCHSFDNVLGLLAGAVAEGTEGLLDEEVERLITERAEARKAKHWARADEIRDLLAAQGILLEDTAQGLRWRRK